MFLFKSLQVKTSPATPTRKSSKALLNMDTHKTSMSHRAPLDHKGSIGQDAKYVSRGILRSSSARPCCRPQSHPYQGQGLLSLAPTWWVGSEKEMTYIKMVWGSPWVENPVLHSGSHLLKKLQEHSFCGPYRAMPGMSYCTKGNPKVRLPTCIYSCPVQLEFTNHHYFYFLLSGF